MSETKYQTYGLHFILENSGNFRCSIHIFIDIRAGIENLN